MKNYSTTFFAIVFFALSLIYAEAIKRSEIEAAIFSNDAKGNLRILRNSIFARHGRVFHDKKLQRYFEKQSWYKENPEYSDSLLTEEDASDIVKIGKYEEELGKITERDQHYLQHLKTVYANYHDGRDSVREIIDDITGDGIRERMLLRAILRDSVPMLIHMVIRGNDTLYSNTQELSFSPESYFDNLYTLGIFEFIYPYMNLEIGFGSEYQVLPLGSFKSNALDSSVTCLPGAKVIHVVTDESGGDCSKIWNSLKGKFVNFYCH